MKNNFKNIKEPAFSLAELMVSVSIMIVIALMLSVSIAKKTAKRLSEPTRGGEFVCYKDTEGRLHQRTSIKYVGGTKPQIQDKVVQTCDYKFPASADRATVYIIGAGGGGGGIPLFNEEMCSIDKNSSLESKLTIYEADSDNSFYYNDGGLYADCTNDGGKTFDPIILDKIDNKFKGRDGKCPTISYNKEIPAPQTIKNELGSYMSDNAYNNLILSTHVISVKGGSHRNYHDKRYYYPSNNADPRLQVGDSLLYYNGKDPMKVGQTYLSPSPGIIEVRNATNRIKVSQKILGAWANGSWDRGWKGDYYNEKNNTNYISESCNPDQTSASCNSYGSEPMSNTPPPFANTTTYYTAKKLLSCDIPYGTAGNAGETLSLNNINFANQRLIIPAENIGTGGIGGSINGNNTNGTRGGNTIYNFGNITRTANGGTFGSNEYGPAVKTKANPAAFDNIEIEKKEWINPKFSKSSEYTQNGPYSDYIKKIIESGGISDDSAYKTKPATCDEATKTCQSSTPADSQSYGAGGAGVNSIIIYDPIYQFSLYKKDKNSKIPNKNHVIIGTYVNTSKVNPIEHKPELVVPQETNGNGMGGAIVVTW